jgi:hypothetical protein
VVRPLFRTAPSDRALFLTRVNFFVGIATYSGLTIMGISDATHGLLLPASNFLICLVLCKAMVVFDDNEEIKLAAQAEQEEEEEQALIGAENGNSPYELLKPVVV